jgi:hypothetical protein
LQKVHILKEKLSTEEIIGRLKIAYNLDKEGDVANFLGISASNLANWKKRDTIDIQLLFTKCKDISMDWLLVGNGAMFRKHIAPAKPAATSANNNISTSVRDEVAQALNRVIDAKDKLIEEMGKRMALMERMVQMQGGAKFFEEVCKK